MAGIQSGGHCGVTADAVRRRWCRRRSYPTVTAADPTAVDLRLSPLATGAVTPYRWQRPGLDAGRRVNNLPDMAKG
jgi:hypothetical protein